MELITESKALTIDEFCRIYGKCCRGTFYNMMRAGLGPRIFHVGGKRITDSGRAIPNGVRISREAAEEWLRQREAAAAGEAGSRPAAGVRDAAAEQIVGKTEGAK